MFVFDRDNWSITVTPGMGEGWLVGSPLTMSLQAAAPGAMRGHVGMEYCPFSPKLRTSECGLDSGGVENWGQLLLPGYPSSRLVWAEIIPQVCPLLPSPSSLPKRHCAVMAEGRV